MYALRERRVHVTQEDFEMAVAKVSARLWGHRLVWASSAGSCRAWRRAALGTNNVPYTFPFLSSRGGRKVPSPPSGGGRNLQSNMFRGWWHSQSQAGGDALGSGVILRVISTQRGSYMLGTVFSSAQVMQKDSEKNMSIKKLWK